MVQQACSLQQLAHALLLLLQPQVEVGRQHPAWWRLGSGLAWLQCCGHRHALATVTLPCCRRCRFQSRTNALALLLQQLLQLRPPRLAGVVERFVAPSLCAVAIAAAAVGCICWPQQCHLQLQQALVQLLTALLCCCYQLLGEAPNIGRAWRRSLCVQAAHASAGASGQQRHRRPCQAGATACPKPPTHHTPGTAGLTAPAAQPAARWRHTSWCGRCCHHDTRSATPAPAPGPVGVVWEANGTMR
jgi:hypothetical protein